MKIPVINHGPHPLPAYQSSGAAGMDLYAMLEEELVLLPLQRHLVPTGISISLPQGWEAQVRPRSGLAIRKGLTCLNSPGTIDSDYRGEIKIILINLSSETQSVQNGERIAQLVISRYEQVEWEPVSELPPSARGPGGFGSTGS